MYSQLGWIIYISRSFHHHFFPPNQISCKSHKNIIGIQSLLTPIVTIPHWTALDYRVTVAQLVRYTVYPKKYAHGFVVLCFVVVTQSFIMNSREVFIHIHQGCFAGTGAIVRLPQCQWSKPDGYGKISQCITTTEHSKAKTVCIFLGIYCIVGIPSMQSISNRRDILHAENQ